MHLEAHIDIAREAFFSMYGIDPGCDARIISKEIATAAAESGYPAGARLLAIVEYSLEPDEGATDGYSAFCSADIGGQLLYNGYTLWHKRPKAAVMPYTSFLENVPCTTSAICSAYALRHAVREGCDAAIHSTTGALTGLAWQVRCEKPYGAASEWGVGEYPLFFVRGRETATPSPQSGAQKSVPAMLGRAALEAIGKNVAIRRVEEHEAATADEIFAVTPQGVVSLKSCDGKLLPCVTAEKVAAAMCEFEHKSPL